MNWEEIRKEYETTDINMAALANKHEVNPSTLRARKNREKWSEYEGNKSNATQRKDATQRNSVANKSKPMVKVPDTDIEDITDINAYYGITEQQRRFADFYIEEPNIYQAATKAGYSHNYANSLGYKLLGNIGIKRYIDDRLKVLANGQIATQADILRQLSSVLFRREEEHQVVTLRNKQEKWVPDENGTMRKQTIETEEPKIISFPTKVSDTLKAADLLSKRLPNDSSNNSGKVVIVKPKRQPKGVDMNE